MLENGTPLAHEEPGHQGAKTAGEPEGISVSSERERFRLGQRLMLVERPFPEWTVASAHDLMHRRADDIRGPDKLQDSEQLAVRWRETLHKRVETKAAGSSTARLYGPNL